MSPTARTPRREAAPLLRTLAVGVVACWLAGCATTAPAKDKDKDGPPPIPAADSPLTITIERNVCGTTRGNGGLQVESLSGVAATAISALVGKVYDGAVDWLESQQAHQSASATGMATVGLFARPGTLNGCLVLKRGTSLEAQFRIEPAPVQDSPYWRIVPYLLAFERSEAKVAPQDAKSILVDISLATPGKGGKLVTYFSGTFDLGRRKAGGRWVAGGPDAAPIGVSDTGPMEMPASDDKPPRDPLLTTLVTATVIEHGESRDWLKAVSDQLKKSENRAKVVQPVVEALTGKK